MVQRSECLQGQSSLALNADAASRSHLAVLVTKAAAAGVDFVVSAINQAGFGQGLKAMVLLAIKLQGAQAQGIHDDTDRRQGHGGSPDLR